MKRGFTLLEILIVIVIVAFMATLGGANYITSLRRGRNAARIQDVKALAGAQEMYFGLHSEYSNIADLSGDCTENDLFDDTNALPEMPVDPQGNDYLCSMNSTTAFCIRALLEDPFNGANCSACDCASGTDCSLDTTTPLESFCVKNLQ